MGGLKWNYFHFNVTWYTVRIRRNSVNSRTGQHADKTSPALLY